MYRLTVDGVETYMVVTRNVFSHRLTVHRKYDLKVKGSVFFCGSTAFLVAGRGCSSSVCVGSGEAHLLELTCLIVVGQLFEVKVTVIKRLVKPWI